MKRTRLYVYGCSLGAFILGSYMSKDGERTGEIIDGAILYAGLWDFTKQHDYLFNNFFGLYHFVIGMTLSLNIQYKVLPQMKPYLSDEDYKLYEHCLQTNWKGISHIEKTIYLKMFGFKTQKEYYRANRITPDIHKI